MIDRFDFEEFLDAYDRARTDGCADEWLRASNDAAVYGLEKVDLSKLPTWAQDLLRAWYGYRVGKPIIKVA